jgi:hypothetical protein
LSGIGLRLQLIEESSHLVLDGLEFRRRGVAEEQVYKPPVECRKFACECPPQSRHRTTVIGRPGAGLEAPSEDRIRFQEVASVAFDS